MKDEIKVSVCVVTYNQEKYIAECLQSLVDQETDFSFEIIVGEDCSTDNTREIIKEFQQKYPELIKLILHENNVGPVENILTIYRTAKSKYIAHMDGDDLAFPSKLQAQYNALEGNPDCVICSHDVDLIHSNGKKLGSSFKKHKGGINTLLDLYENLPFFAHSSKMFINDMCANFWNELHPKALDIEIHVQQAKKGNIYHIDECLGAYRSFTGVSSKSVGVNPILVDGTTRIFESALQNSDLNQDAIKRNYAVSMYRYAYQAAVRGDEDGLKKYINRSIDLCVFSTGQSTFNVLSNFPKIVVFLCQLRARLRGYDVFK